MQKPCFLLLGSQMETGGAQRNLLSQALWLHRQGYRVTTAFLYDKESLYKQWQEKYPFPILDMQARRWQGGKLKNGLLFLRGLFRLNHVMRAGHFDAIETFTHHANLAGIPLAWLNRIPVRIANHRGRFKGFPKWQEKIHAVMVNSKMTGLLVVNSKQLSGLAVEEGVKAEKITMIVNGVEIIENDQYSQQQVRQELGIDENISLVLSVGRLRFEKGHTFLLQAIPAVLAKHPNTLFVLAGDGTLRAALEQEASSLGIQHAVRFLGTRQDARNLMSAADVFVLPSRSEGMPNALLEAMSTGTAAISTRVAGAEEIIENGVNGLLVERENPRALSDAIIHLLDDSSLRRKLGEAGMKTITANYSLEGMCRKFCNLLEGEIFQERP